MIKIGADLIIQDVIIRQKPTIALWNKIEKALDKKVDKMSEDELKGWAEEVYVCEGGNLKDLKKIAHEVVKTAIKGFDFQRKLEEAFKDWREEYDSIEGTDEEVEVAQKDSLKNFIEQIKELE